MATIERLFVTKVYRAALGGAAAGTLNRDLARACRVIAEDDQAGQDWCRDNGYRGYTSYASLADLGWRAPEFAALQRRLDRHVATFLEELEYDLDGRSVELDSLWINILEPGGMHGSHLHPQSLISGTYYVEVPDGAGALKLEDPRLGMMMGAPLRKPKAALEQRPFVSVAPRPGLVVLWESWLRHEVPVNQADSPRISISFNYRWTDAAPLPAEPEA